MTSRQRRLLGLVLSAVQLLAFEAVAAVASFQPIAPSGDTLVHDPSSIVRENDRYFLFATGGGIRRKSSLDLMTWTDESPVFAALPAWTTNLVPGFRGYAWAPDVVRVRDTMYLYYSVSTFGRQTSAIGLTTAPGADPGAVGAVWTDHGAVLSSTNGSPFNAIDPGVFLDRDDRLWLAFGSFWQGIHLVELDADTGLRLNTNTPPTRLAWAEAIEAPCLTRHGDWYYLFVNWGRCCRGTNSTYEVRVGRSKNVAGPYLDQENNDLALGGGTAFLSSQGRFIGPGHVGIYREGAITWFSFHYYDPQSGGRSRLALGHLYWTKDGWPVAADSPMSGPGDPFQSEF